MGKNEWGRILILRIHIWRKSRYLEEDRTIWSHQSRPLKVHRLSLHNSRWCYVYIDFNGNCLMELYSMVDSLWVFPSLLRIIKTTYELARVKEFTGCFFGLHTQLHAPSTKGCQLWHECQTWNLNIAILHILSPILVFTFSTSCFLRLEVIISFPNLESPI